MNNLGQFSTVLKASINRGKVINHKHRFFHCIAEEATTIRVNIPMVMLFKHVLQELALVGGSWRFYIDSHVLHGFGVVTLQKAN